MVRGKIGVNVGHVCSSSLGGVEFAERRGVFSDLRATMTNFLLSHRDCVILAAGAVLVFAVLHRWLWRERTKGVVVPVMWVIVLTVPGGGWFLVEGAAQRERDRLRQMVEGYAPTYAQELEAPKR